MLFSDIIGQDDIKQRLLRMKATGHVPHAMLFAGQEGVGKLAMAIAFGQYLMCGHSTSQGACGQCPTCRQVSAFTHPDVHFSFPIVKRKSTDPGVCTDFMEEWFGLLRQTRYFSLDDWLDTMGDDKKQAVIFEKESDRIIDELSVTAYAGGYKVMIIWLPERLNASASNNLLKMLEEPTDGTVFILVSNEPDKLLTTIVSRTQPVYFQPLQQQEIVAALVERNGLDGSAAQQIARLSEGSYLKALRLISVREQQEAFFAMFAMLMRAAYARDLVALKEWSSTVAAWGRERQKAFVEYCLNMIRENFIYNLHQPSLNYMTQQESQFAVRFARFINERNVTGFAEEFTHAGRDIAQNVKESIVWFDLAMRCIVLIRK